MALTYEQRLARLDRLADERYRMEQTLGRYFRLGRNGGWVDVGTGRDVPESVVQRTRTRFNELNTTFNQMVDRMPMPGSRPSASAGSGSGSVRG